MALGSETYFWDDCFLFVADFMYVGGCIKGLK